MAYLPTYEDAVKGVGILELLPRYLDDKSLATSCRVSAGWHKALCPSLWADPVVVLATKQQPYGMCFFARNSSGLLTP